MVPTLILPNLIDPPKVPSLHPVLAPTPSEILIIPFSGMLWLQLCMEMAFLLMAILTAPLQFTTHLLTEPLSILPSNIQTLLLVQSLLFNPLTHTLGW